MIDELLLKSISENLAVVRARIRIAAIEAGRSVDSVKLVVVTKSQPLGVIETVLQEGAGCLGENYPEESLAKILSIADRYPVEWHMIGHLQSRKAKIVVENFSMLQSLDSDDLGIKLGRLADVFGRRLPVLLEFNVSGEESKNGWGAWDESQWEKLAHELRPVMETANLEVRGLMTMPPFSTDPEQTRPYFQKLSKLKEYLGRCYPELALDHLSMGTSVDYITAIQEGATMVRIGTAIVGPRPIKLV